MENKFYRTLIRVVKVYEEHIVIIVPSWNSEIPIVISKTSLPDAILPYLETGFRCHVHVNIGTEFGDNLEFKDWEFSEKAFETPISKVRNLLSPIVNYFALYELILKDSDPLVKIQLEKLLNEEYAVCQSKIDPLVEIIKNDSNWD